MESDRIEANSSHEIGDNKLSLLFFMAAAVILKPEQTGHFDYHTYEKYMSNSFILVAVMAIDTWKYSRFLLISGASITHPVTSVQTRYFLEALRCRYLQYQITVE